KSFRRATDSYGCKTVPACGNSNMHTLQNGNVVAVDPSGSPNRWTFQNGSLVTAPVVNGGVVYVGSGDGTVYGVSARSGAKLWTGKAGSTIIGGSLGMAIGGRLLVGPAGPGLTVFGS